MLKTALAIAAIAGTLIVPSVAAAEGSAIVTRDVIVRAGPGTAYERLATIRHGGAVRVENCRSTERWCRVNWGGRSGWISSRYLEPRSPRLARYRTAPEPDLKYRVHRHPDFDDRYQPYRRTDHHRR